MRQPSYRLHRSSGQAVVTINGRDVYLGKHDSKESRAYYNQLMKELEQTGKVEKLSRSEKSKGPSYRLHKASGKAVVTLGGKDFYLGPYNSPKSKAEYNRLKQEYFQSGCSPTFGVKAPLLVRQLSIAFGSYAKSYYGTGPNSEYQRYRTVLSALTKEYGYTLAAEFDALRFETLRATLAEPYEVKRADGTREILRRSRSYINVQMKRIRSVFRWAVSKKMVPSSLIEELRSVKALEFGRTDAPELEPIVSVPQEIVDATIPHLNYVVAAMVKLQQACGARPGEICRLTPGIIDEVTTTNKVTGETNITWIADFKAHKTAYRGHKRQLAIGPIGQEILKPFMVDRNPEHFIFSPAEAMSRRLEERRANRTTPESCGNVPGSNVAKHPKKQPGRCYSTQSYAKSIRASCEKAGIEPWAPNRLRHSFATRVNKSEGVDRLSKALGHSSTAITSRYVDDGSLEVAVQIAQAHG